MADSEITDTVNTSLEQDRGDNTEGLTEFQKILRGFSDGETTNRDSINQLVESSESLKALQDSGLQFESVMKYSPGEIGLASRLFRFRAENNQKIDIIAVHKIDRFMKHPDEWFMARRSFPFFF